MMNTLEIKSFSAGYVGSSRTGVAVSDVSLDVKQGEILGLVGESGSGKTTLTMGLLRLLELPGKVFSGKINLHLPDGISYDLLAVPDGLLRQIRWKHIGYVPQSSMSALNPVLTVKRQMTDTLIEHKMKPNEALERTRWSLSLVNLTEKVLDLYPHELSGGMTQRVTIASAISMQPAVLVVDEPTSALDVVTQRMILQELLRIRAQFGMTIIFISHDMGVIAQIADRMAVMYAGQLVEVGSVQSVFNSSLHPYTQKLIASIPRFAAQRLEGLKGESPNIWNFPSGCRFHPRCPKAMPICHSVSPKPELDENSSIVACHLYTKEIPV